MTEDTKRALEAIAPIAKELRIDVSADENILYCNGQAIGIACNSTYATIMEFIGYVFATTYNKDRLISHGIPIPARLMNRIQDYWFTDSQLKMNKDRMGK